MPLDPIFTSDWKPRPSRRVYRASKIEKLQSFEPKESVELQTGRSDFLLGALQRECPFPPTGSPPDDASEWTRGWLAEHAIEVNTRIEAEKLHPPWKLRKRRSSRDPK